MTPQSAMCMKSVYVTVLTKIYLSIYIFVFTKIYIYIYIFLSTVTLLIHVKVKINFTLQQAMKAKRRSSSIVQGFLTSPLDREG